MLWVFKITLVSIVIITIVHHILEFMKNSLTQPKVRNIFDMSSHKHVDINTVNHEPDKESIKMDMKEELKQFVTNHIETNKI